MDSPWPRYLVALVFVVLVSAPYYLDALGSWNGESGISDRVAIALIAVVFFGTGFLTGRWWALLLPLAPVLLTLPLGVNPEDSDGWTFAWLLIWGPMLIGVPSLVFGYAVRVVVDARVRHSRPASH